MNLLNLITQGEICIWCEFPVFQKKEVMSPTQGAGNCFITNLNSEPRHLCIDWDNSSLRLCWSEERGWHERKIKKKQRGADARGVWWNEKRGFRRENEHSFRQRIMFKELTVQASDWVHGKRTTFSKKQLWLGRVNELTTRDQRSCEGWEKKKADGKMSSWSKNKYGLRRQHE